MQEATGGRKKDYVKCISRKLGIWENETLVDTIVPVSKVKRVSRIELNKISTDLFNLISSRDDKEIKPFWNDAKQKLSENMWFPKELVESKCFILKGSTKNGSWFNLNEYKDDSDIYTFNADITHGESYEPRCTENGIKTIKVSLFPTDIEIKKLKHYMETFRWAWNSAVQIFSQNYGYFLKCNKFVTNNVITNLFRKYVYSEEDGLGIYTYTEENTRLPFAHWNKDVHNRVFRSATRKFIWSVNCMISNYRNGNCETPPKLRFKKRKDSTQYMTLDDAQYPRWINKIYAKYWYTDTYGKRRYLHLKDISLSKGFEIHHDKQNDRFFMYVPVNEDWYPNDDRRNKKNKRLLKERSKTIALDPGVRKFLVGYDPSGKTIIVGEGANKKLTELLYTIDKTESKGGKTYPLWRKMKNMVTDLHWKTINYLMCNYQTIILPDFRISQMVKKRNLAKITKRLLHMFSYYSFKERLAYKCSLYGKELIIVNEAYTSKTCGSCGYLNDCGGNEQYFCKKCDLKTDRDVMASRNIMIKTIDLC